MLLGNPPEVLRRVRDPFAVAEALRTRGCAVPEVRLQPDTADGEAVASGVSRSSWILKPLKSGGGQRIRAWKPGARLGRRSYLQRFVSGTPGSIVFVSAGGRAVPLGVSRQLVGEPAFGAGGYRYCGSILNASLETPLGRAAAALADAVADEFHLVGLNGIDFIAVGDVPHVIEVNPRWCSSMELVERTTGASLFAMHAAACRENQLPSSPSAAARVAGKAIVFAERDFVVPDTRGWLDDPDIRDVPRPGESIAAGQPICTVFAHAADAEACHRALVRRADAIFRATGRSDARDRTLTFI